MTRINELRIDQETRSPSIPKKPRFGIRSGMIIGYLLACATFYAFQLLLAP